MDYALSFEEVEVMKAVGGFARQHILPVAKEIDAAGHLAGVLKRQFLDLGVLGLPFPEQYGGVASTFTAMALAVRELGYASLVPANMVAENFILAMPLYLHGSDFLKETYLPGLISMEASGALAFTEPDTGSDPRQLKTVAKKVDGGWVINGAKRFITHSGTCNQMILFAKVEPAGVGAFLVENGKPGYSAGKRESFIHMTMDNGDVLLDNYFAPDSHLIGSVEQGFEILLHSEAVGKVVFCAMFLGAARRAVDLALEYANAKTHRDKPIGAKFAMIQEKAARMAVLSEAMNSQLLKACSLVDVGKEVTWDAAVLKLMAAENLRQIVADAMEIHGAYSLSTEYEVSRFHALAAALPVVMGAMDIQKVIIAKKLLAQGKYRPWPG